MKSNKKYIMALSLMILLFAGCDTREGVVVNVSPTELYIEDTENKELKRFVSEMHTFANFRIGDTVTVERSPFAIYYNHHHFFKQEQEGTPCISAKDIEYANTRAAFNELARETGMPCR